MGTTQSGGGQIRVDPAELLNAVALLRQLPRGLLEVAAAARSTFATAESGLVFPQAVAAMQAFVAAWNPVLNQIPQETQFVVNATTAAADAYVLSDIAAFIEEIF